MFKNILLFVLVGHILGDFYFQTEDMAEKKKSKISWVLVHGLLYAGAVFVISIPFISQEVLVIAGSVAVLHFVIDMIKFLCTRKKKDNSKIFVIDQCAHMLCLIGVAYVSAKCNYQINSNMVLKDFFDTIGISQLMFAKWVLGLLLIHKPANILIQNLICEYKPKEKVEKIQFKPDHNAGRMIGSVERILMFVLMYMNQFSAIGLVLTAKSIARYDQISKDKDFAEYYLLGTLISTGLVITCAGILFGIN
ncbi:MAG: DUF3307 domain-containing protein [Lachnospiraceae bacterium]|nr:DUF3307 domain-containing protein [Lachnospiraceae bacterium]